MIHCMGRIILYSIYNPRAEIYTYRHQSLCYILGDVILVHSKPIIIVVWLSTCVYLRIYFSTHVGIVRPQIIFKWRESNHDQRNALQPRCYKTIVDITVVL